uniref:General transcription factor IIH subunit 4 n=1 Tax=Pelodiscus sinensis TaxID=13735 RepID=K7FGW7_PELSI
MDSVMKLQRVQLKCKNLHEFLRGLSPGILDRLYNHPATCLAVFRELPGLAKNYVMRMLFLEQPLPQAAVALWVKKEHVKWQEESWELLLGLRLWHTQLLPGGLQGLVLNPIFKENLRVALLGGVGTRCYASLRRDGSPRAELQPFLGRVEYNMALRGWAQVILHFMVGSPSAAVSQDLAQLLIQAGLMKSSEPGEPPCITSAGTRPQLWYFMLQYLQSAETRGMDLVEILSFLFQLSPPFFNKLFQDYSVEGMSDSLLNFLQHLREFGLVFQRKVCGLRGLVPGKDHPSWQEELWVASRGCQPVTLSPSPADYSLPTDPSAPCDAETGETGGPGLCSIDIIHFLRTRAHPVMLRQTPVLPPTITDQIRLWEMERDRLRFSEGVLYNQFLSQVDFELLRNHARDLGVLVFENPAKRLMVVTPAGHSDVKRFWKRQKQSS